MKTKTLTMVAAGAFLALSGCVNPNDIEAETKPIQDSRVIAMAKSLISERMRDPEATRFKSDFSAYQTSVGDYIVCGTLNAKNAMGGYVGYKPFYMRIRNNSIEALKLPSENEYAAAITNQVREACAEAATGKIMVST